MDTYIVPPPKVIGVTSDMTARVVGSASNIMDFFWDPRYSVSTCDNNNNWNTIFCSCKLQVI